MIQVKGLPPNFEAIVAVFPDAAGPNTIFAFGDVIYVPSGNNLPQELYDHERVHGARQTDIGVERWWNQYLADPKFRWDEELMAHAAEYRSFCTLNRDRNVRSRYLAAVSQRLASPLYGRLMSYREAKRLIVDKLR